MVVGKVNSKLNAFCLVNGTTDLKRNGSINVSYAGKNKCCEITPFLEEKSNDSQLLNEYSICNINKVMIPFYFVLKKEKTRFFLKSDGPIFC